MSHLNLPERIHEKPIEDNYYEIYGIKFPINPKAYAWHTAFKPKEDGELFNRATKGLTAKWVDTRTEDQKSVMDLVMIQNPQGNVYYATKSEAEEMKEQMSKTNERISITMYGLI